MLALVANKGTKHSGTNRLVKLETQEAEYENVKSKCAKLGKCVGGQRILIIEEVLRILFVEIKHQTERYFRINATVIQLPQTVK